MAAKSPPGHGVSVHVERLCNGKLQPLLLGSIVRVICSKDSWLERYSGMQARVERDDGLVVDVLFVNGDLLSFWRDEVEPVESMSHFQADERAALPEPRQRSGQQGPIPGFSLQAERRRAGLTQVAIATAMGVSVPRISQIEARPAVRNATATRYLVALRAARASAA
jgi:hypothetical protein